VTPKFRLESVLRLRRLLRDEAELRAAEAHRAAREAADLARRRHADARTGAYERGGAAVFLASVDERSRRAQSARAAEHAAGEARHAHRARLEELTAAAMAVSALERVEERAHDAWRTEERRREAREVDDLVTARVARAGRVDEMPVEP
jgi:hypothetical protein